MAIDYLKVGCGVTKSLDTGLTLETGPSHSITITEFQFDDNTLSTHLNILILDSKPITQWEHYTMFPFLIRILQR